MVKRIEYYRTREGNCPVEEFLFTLNAKEQARIYWVLSLFETLDRVPAEYFKKLTNTEEIWECRIHASGKAYRIFSFFFQGDTVVLTNGYSKKSRKTDAREIARAERYCRDYLSRHEGHQQ